MDDDDGTQQTLHCLADWLPLCVIGAVLACKAVAAAATEDGDLKLFCLFS